MTISQLITTLQSFQKDIGDTDVLVNREDIKFVYNLQLRGKDVVDIY